MKFDFNSFCPYIWADRDCPRYDVQAGPDLRRPADRTGPDHCIDLNTDKSIFNISKSFK